MNLRHLTSAFTALVLTGTAIAATAGPAQTAQAPKGTTSLAAALAADGNRFDRNANDFDILDRAIRDILKANPSSGIAVVKDGTKPLTAFAPTDQAFRVLAEAFTGKNIASERRVYRTLKGAATQEQIEAVILYHAIPGKTLTYNKLKGMDGKRLQTGLPGAKVKVKVTNGRVVLVDKDKDDANARIIVALKNLNKGNRQIAQGVDLVLRPLDLESLIS